MQLLEQTFTRNSLLALCMRKSSTKVLRGYSLVYTAWAWLNIYVAYMRMQ